MNHFKKKKITALILPSGNSSLHPPTLLHPSHINHQSEVAACAMQMGITHTHPLRTRETRSPVNRARLQFTWLQPQLCAFVCSAKYRCPLRPCPFAWEVGLSLFTKRAAGKIKRSPRQEAPASCLPLWDGPLSSLVWVWGLFVLDKAPSDPSEPRTP